MIDGGVQATDDMYLVQLLLPVYDNTGEPFPGSHYASVRSELAECFGGLTAYTRAPAEGLWSDDGGRASRDDIVVYEVMVEQLDRQWWGRFRADLERRFAQQELVVRAQAIERL